MGDDCLGKGVDARHQVDFVDVDLMLMQLLDGSIIETAAAC